MATGSIVDLAGRRQYSELEKQADELIKKESWNQLLNQLKHVRPDIHAGDTETGAGLQLGLRRYRHR